MTRQDIIKKISSIPVEKMVVVQVQCRPAEKSNQVLVVNIDGKKWFCERPKYFWSNFDRAFLEKPYLSEQKLLYPGIHEPMTIFDKRGLLWSREEMSSFGLLKYFLEHPNLYLSAMAEHTYDAQNIIQQLKDRKKIWQNTDYLAENFRIIHEMYARFYRFQSSIFMLFDEMAYRFRELLIKYLTKEEVNLYFPNFLSGEATKLALLKGYVAERAALEYQTTRGVLYAMSLKPRAFYAKPQFFSFYENDGEIVLSLLAKKILSKDLQIFMSYRMMLPFGYQINEEAQYIETAGLSAHLGVLMKMIAKKTGYSVDQLQAKGMPAIVKLLK